MSKKIVWATDIHLDHAKEDKIKDFIRSINDQSPDAVLIGGDIGVGDNISDCLSFLSKFINSEIYFVLGNHDYWGSSFKRVKEKVRRLASRRDNLFFLDYMPAVRLDEDTALVGQGCWADGRYGDFTNSSHDLHDHHLIEDLRNLKRSDLLSRLNKLGDKEASRLKSKLEKAFEDYQNVICLTHIPPFRETCRYNGKPQSKYFLPFYSCKTAGEVVKEVMQQRPDSKLTILSGHTHGKFQTKISDNILALSGGAKYGHPKIQKIIYI